MADSEAMRELTFGEKMVGINFNPSENPIVTSLKMYYASIIDQLDVIREASDSPEVKRLCSVAITEAQGAQMWAVKAATWELN